MRPYRVTARNPERPLHVRAGLPSWGLPDERELERRRLGVSLAGGGGASLDGREEPPGIYAQEA